MYRFIYVFVFLIIHLASAFAERSAQQLTFHRQLLESKKKRTPLLLKNEIPHAKINTIKGYPRLTINNKYVVPFLSFVNSDAISFESKTINERQIKLASNYGDIHIHQVNASVWKEDGEWNFSRLDEALQRALTGDPNGFILLRLDLSRECISPYYEDREKVKYSNGRLGDQVSIASKKWQESSKSALINTIKYIQEIPQYSSKVFGYNFTAGGGREWFQYDFVDYGVDVSEVNTEGFNRWLEEKYGRKFNVEIPHHLLGNGWIKGTDRVQYTKLEDIIVVDYLDYYNEMVSSLIAEMADIIKHYTDNKSLVGLYYGYQLELPDARSGHFAFNTLLNDKNIDFIASPVCYNDRNEGGVGAEMSLIESIHAHGKIYFYECDFRSPHNSLDNYVGDGINKSISNHDYLIQVFRRQIGYQMLKGAGGWTYDLAGRGWYDNQAFWEEIKSLKNLYSRYDKVRPNRKHEVVLIVDEDGFKLAADPWQITKYLLNNIRDELYKTGVDFGIYLSKDLQSGLVPEAKLYLMVGAFNLDDNQSKKLSLALQQKGKTTVWFWNFGNTTEDNIKLLTGFKVKSSQNKGLPTINLTEMGKNVLSLSANENRGEKPISINYIETTNQNYRVLGKTNNKATFVENRLKGSNQIFYGSYFIDKNLIRSIARYANVHLFSESDDALIVNSNMLVIHSAKSGKKRINLPARLDVYDYYENKWYEKVDNLSFKMRFGQTKLLFYGNKKELSFLSN